MSLSNLSVEQLEHAIVLLKEREALQSKLDDVSRKLQRLDGRGSGLLRSTDKSVTLSSGKKSIRPRGKLQKSVLKVLKTAGAKGLTIKELVLQAKVKPASLRVWLYTKAKTVGVKKLAPGTFAFAS